MGKIIASPLTKSDRLSFGSPDDLLGREPFGERMMGLIQSASTGGVFALDARWGEGKTTFIKMWQHMLEDNRYTCAYLDAFEQDHADDPFLPLVASIIELGDNQAANQQAIVPTLAKVKKNAARLGVKFLGWAGNMAVRVATQGVINTLAIDALTNVEDDIVDGGAKTAKDFFEAQMSRFVSDKRTLTEFRNDLETLAGEIVKEGKGPLIFIIDELDRCRPTFAVSLIERIKHVLDVPGIVFVFVLNRKQLEEAVRSVYGSGIDAAEYLGKFIHVWLLLPKGVSQGHFSIYKKYCTALYQAHDLDTWDDKKDLQIILPELSRKFALTLREMERVFTSIAIFYATVKKKHLRIPVLVAALSILRIRSPLIYRKLRDSQLTYADFCQSAPEIKRQIGDESCMNYMHDLLLWCLMPEAEWEQQPKDSNLRRIGMEFSRHGVANRTTIVPYLCDFFDMFDAN